jgi:hypothetical protein
MKSYMWTRQSARYQWKISIMGRWSRVSCQKTLRERSSDGPCLYEFCSYSLLDTLRLPSSSQRLILISNTYSMLCKNVKRRDVSLWVVSQNHASHMPCAGSGGSSKSNNIDLPCISCCFNREVRTETSEFVRRCCSIHWVGVMVSTT